MENNSYLPMQEEETIDLKEMFFYVLRKWKIIVALILVGALLGGGFALSKGESTPTSNVSSQTYLISSDFFTTDLINAKISNLVHDDADLDAIKSEIGIELENNKLRQIISIEQTKTDTSPQAFADTASGTQVTLTVTHEDTETCQKVAKAADQLMQNLSDSFAQEYENYSFEKISENMETTATTSSPSPVKYAIIGAIALAAVAAIAYAVLYLFNGTIKNMEEIRSLFGLYPIAQLADTQKKPSALPANSKNTFWMPSRP